MSSTSINVYIAPTNVVETTPTNAVGANSPSIKDEQEYIISAKKYHVYLNDNCVCIYCLKPECNGPDTCDM